jgi:glycosyltransferase involved in cell wall biosynthesis
MHIPKVSVCIPTYNSEYFLPEAIQSVLKQSFTDYELIVIDNCSADNTQELMQNYINADPRICYLRNSDNKGMVKNWNLCLEKAKGEYIKFLFADDLLASEDAIKEMVSVLDRNPSVSLVASSRRIIDSSSKEIDTWKYAENDIITAGFKVIKQCLLKNKNCIGEPSSVMFRKCQASRGFDEKYRQLVDQEMWFHLLEQGEFAYLSEPLCAFRVHSQQQTNVNAKSNASLYDMQFLLREYLNKPEINISLLSRKYIQYDFAYQIWKTFRKHKSMSKDEAVSLISNYGIIQFILLMPIYKTCKPIRKLLLF